MCDYVAVNSDVLQLHIEFHYSRQREAQQQRHDGVRYSCEQCEYVATTVSSLKQHKDAKHEGVRYSCDQCEFTGSKAGLWDHKKSKHEGVRHPCDQCEYVATKLSNLKQHKDAKHEGVRYSCDQCEYVATQVSNLKRHKKTKHEGVRYPCDQCEYVATTVSNLKRHKKIKHEGVRYPCDQCEYAATAISSLKQHKKVKHEVVRYPGEHKEQEGLQYSCEPRINDCAKMIMKNVSVMIENLNVSKYQSLLKNVKLEQQVLKKETNSNGMFAEIKVEDYSNEIPTDGNKDTCDLQTKIEIEEDLTLKTESSDLSEFLDPTDEGSRCGVVTSCVHD